MVSLSTICEILSIRLTVDEIVFMKAAIAAAVMVVSMVDSFCNRDCCVEAQS